MNEEEKNTEVIEEENTETEANNEEEEANKTYTEEEVQVMMKERVARERKAAKKEVEKEVEEAKKLAQMNADEKREHERQKLEEELAEYKRKDQFYSLSKEASKMLSEHDIHADDELLSFVVKDDAEATQTAVNSFVTMFNSKVEEGVKQALSGKSPKVHARTEKVISAEEFKNMTYPEKVQLKTDNPEMYNKIIKE